MTGYLNDWASPYTPEKGRKKVSPQMLASITDDDTLGDFKKKEVKPAEKPFEQTFEQPRFEPKFEPKPEKSEPFDPKYYREEAYPMDPVMIDKLNYLIRLLEDQRDEKTGYVTEEIILYMFLGIFVIFVLDSFVKTGKYSR
jgi:hypothetical protein